MHRWIVWIFLASAALWQPAQARTFNQAELDALLAPVALYPDTVLSHILVAATHPDEVAEAAEWSRANPQLAGEAAVQAAEPMPWHPSVKALVAFPDLIARMAESPRWTEDLGEAFLEQEPHVMDTVQSLRRRAQASGHLQSNAQQQIYAQGDAIAVYPAQPQIVYLPYYDPYVVYGPWWWHSYRPVYWRPWHPRPAVFVSVHKPFHHHHAVDWHRRHVVRHHFVEKRSHAPVTIHNHAHPHRPIVQGARIPEVRVPVRPGVHHEPRRGHRADHQPRQHREFRQERREYRHESRREHRAEHRPSRPVAIPHQAHQPRAIVQSPGIREMRSPVRPGVHNEVRREHRAEHRGHAPGLFNKPMPGAQRQHQRGG